MKIVIAGVSASGKTTFAKKLGDALSIPVFHVDAFMWQPGWDYIGDEKTHDHIIENIKGDDWILEGYIVKSAREEVYGAADVILYLDYPGYLSAWRYIKRWLAHRKEPRLELPGSPETFSFSFLERVYTKREVYNVEKLFKEHDWNDKIIRFKKPSEAETYLENV